MLPPESCIDHACTYSVELPAGTTGCRAVFAGAGEVIVGGGSTPVLAATSKTVRIR